MDSCSANINILRTFWPSVAVIVILKRRKKGMAVRLGAFVDRRTSASQLASILTSTQSCLNRVMCEVGCLVVTNGYELSCTVSTQRHAKAPAFFSFKPDRIAALLLSEPTGEGDSGTHKTTNALDSGKRAVWQVFSDELGILCSCSRWRRPVHTLYTPRCACHKKATLSQILTHSAVSRSSEHGTILRSDWCLTPLSDHPRQSSPSTILRLDVDR